MKKILLLTLLTLSSLFCLQTYAKTNTESLDKIVAIINDDVVTKSELTRGIAAAKAQIAQENIAMPSDKQIEKQVLDQLINKKLQLQAAHQSSIKTTDEEIDNAVKTVAAQNNMTVAELYQRIKQEGMVTDEYRREIQDQITVQKLQQQEVAGKVNVTPAEITAFLHSNNWQTQPKGDKEYRVEDILIPLNDEPKPEEIASAKKHAETIVNVLNSGKTFADVMKLNPSDKTVLQDGDLGWRKLAEVPTAFADKVASMQKNGVAGPIQAGNGFHVIRLTDLRYASDANGQPAKPDKKTAESMLLQKKFEAAVREWVAKLRTQAFIVTNPNQE